MRGNPRRGVLVGSALSPERLGRACRGPGCVQLNAVCHWQRFGTPGKAASQHAPAGGTSTSRPGTAPQRHGWGCVTAPSRCRRTAPCAARWYGLCYGVSRPLESSGVFVSVDKRVPSLFLTLPHKNSCTFLSKLTQGAAVRLYRND